ncbi:hypothetical protein EJ04DRAFT_550630 [Polyplosphaeria fusca]|uniref:Uncharacterized protein n=1 Tax=Polyplosphaeria fusca TaxID=682080 RepID=A0A9P4R5R9_9PLEO|nr:hypothetical protein EJ04DRAFT_550630 [Polyplosphaeria fusca]
MPSLRPAPHLQNSLGDMTRFNISRITALSYLVFLASLLLLALCITDIVLESKLDSVFSRRFQVQYPGSSLAEWLFVPLDPNYIDSGPAIAKFINGAVGILAAVVGMCWIGATWWGMHDTVTQKVGIVSCVLSFISTASALAVLTYVFVSESSNHLPDDFIQWGEKNDVTREFYVCKAFPSVFEDPDSIFRLPACQYAVSTLQPSIWWGTDLSQQVSRVLLIPITTIAVLLTVFSIVQGWKSVSFRPLPKPKRSAVGQAEKGIHGADASFRVQKPRPVVRKDGWHYEYYSKL